MAILVIGLQSFRHFDILMEFLYSKYRVHKNTNISKTGENQSVIFWYVRVKTWVCHASKFQVRTLKDFWVIEVWKWSKNSFSEEILDKNIKLWTPKNLIFLYLDLSSMYLLLIFQKLWKLDQKWENGKHLKFSGKRHLWFSTFFKYRRYFKSAKTPKNN